MLSILFCIKHLFSLLNSSQLLLLHGPVALTLRDLAASATHLSRLLGWSLCSIEYTSEFPQLNSVSSSLHSVLPDLASDHKRRK